MKKLLVLASLLVGILMMAAMSFESVSVTEDSFERDIALSVPAGENGDLLIASVVMRDNRTIIPPEGWTEISEGPCGSHPSRFACRVGVWSRIAKDEPESYLFTWPAERVGYGEEGWRGRRNNGRERAAGAILRYSGVVVGETETITGRARRASLIPLSGPSVLYILGADNDVLRGYPSGLTGRFSIEASGRGGDVGLIAADGPALSGIHFHLRSHSRWRGISIVLDPMPPKRVAAPPYNRAPEAFIGNPGFYSVFQVGETVRFSGLGTDPEDGNLIGASLAWTSSIDGPIGIGESFETSTLSPGTHTIRLAVTDGGDLTSDAFRQITVTP